MLLIMYRDNFPSPLYTCMYAPNSFLLHPTLHPLLPLPLLFLTLSTSSSYSSPSSSSPLPTLPLLLLLLLLLLLYMTMRRNVDFHVVSHLKLTVRCPARQPMRRNQTLLYCRRLSRGGIILTRYDDLCNNG